MPANKGFLRLFSDALIVSSAEFQELPHEKNFDAQQILLYQVSKPSQQRGRQLKEQLNGAVA